ncbi:hypothetical protein [Flavobacterium psychrotrophum]|uniref:hypothetical protein n=1 Tax=Flavobacterium psychrotrophum TaxID=2294119 RepID=UPI000E30C5B3|nr:hypothetical protein [Flavobacterium psychrotrophum]
MIIVNKNSNYSGTGLGKLPYVSAEVNALLAAYSTIAASDKYKVQVFVDAIGGLNGAIYGKLKTLMLPIFAASALEGVTNFKTGLRAFLSLTDAQVPTVYALNSRKLYQNDAVSPASLVLAATTNAYKISPFGVVGAAVTPAVTNNYVSNIAEGNIVFTATNVLIQKAYGGQNQNVAINNSATIRSFAASGIEGTATATQNALYLNNVEGLQAVRADFSLTQVTQIGSIGKTLTATGGAERLNGLYVHGIAEGLTKAEALLLERSLNALVTSIIV